MPEIQQVLFDSLVIAFFVLGIAATIIGLGLIIASGAMFRMFAVMNRYVSTRHGFKPMSMPHTIEPTVLRYRRSFGVAFIIGAVYSIYSLVVSFDMASISAALVTSPAMAHPLIPIIVEALRWFMVAAGVFACIIGVLLIFSPQVLRAIETRANRWYSVRKATVGAEVVHLTLDRWVEAYPRVAGSVITLGALIVVLSSAVLLFKPA